MIDYEFEARLIDRIAARELIARRLTPRQRRLLCRTVRYGETCAEVGKAEGISAGRAQQIVTQATALLLDRHARASFQPAQQGFDRAAFLVHMQRLIEARRQRNAEIFALERAELDRLLDTEEKPKPAPQPKPPPIVPVWHLPTYYTQQLQPQNVEPWFRPDRQLTRDDLIQIARYALSYFTAALRKPWSTQSTAGWQVVTAICARNADAIAGTLYPLAQGVPLHACLSRLAVAIPGVALETDGGAIRVTQMEDGRISMVLSYDI